MSNSEIINSLVEKVTSVLKTTESELSNLKDDDSGVNFSSFMEKIATAVSLTESEKQNLSSVVKQFIYNHDDYEIARGINGGVRKKKEKTPKQQKTKKVTDEAKQEILKEIDMRIAAKTPPIESLSDEQESEPISE